MRKKIQQLFLIHTIQRMNVDAECSSDVSHVHPEAFQQIDKFHFTAREGIMKFRTAMVTLWPATAFDQAEMAVPNALPFARRYYRSLWPGTIEHG